MDTRTCSWCGQMFHAPIRPGPTPRYCRPSHRQRAYEARRKAAQTDGVSSAPFEARSPSGGGPFIRVLGPIEAFDLHGCPVSLGPSLRRVLAILAVRPREVVSREAFIDRVWPDVDDRVASRRLHTAVWKLRLLLAGGDEAEARRLIRWSAPGYLLDVSDDHLDWARFRRLRQAGERALREGAHSLARGYLSAALSLWNGPEVLAGVDVSADDLGFVAERLAGRERAARNLIQARFELGDQVIPDLEGLVTSDPLDEQSVWQLATTYYRAGEVARAIDVCDRYLKEAADLGLDHPLRIAELRTAGMGGGLQHVDGPSPRSSTGESRARRSLLHRVYLSALWDLTPTIGGPLPAELHLIIEGYGGEIHKAGEVAVDVSFFEARPALEAALALHERLGGRVARVGLDVRDGRGMTERFEAPPRARARLLAAAAREGQVLVCGAAHIESGSLPIGARLRPLGEHRLNALGPAVGIHQVTSPRLPPTRREPRWFDEDPVHGLLAEPSRFIGRERELAAITDALARSRLATLTGAPGSGKTRLATRVASGLAGEYKDGVWFTPLQPLPSGGLVPGTLAEALRMPRPATVNLGALVRYLSDKHALLVIDNCEHVLSECRETVDALLLGCPNISILATSREALYSEFENVVPVPPMDLPPRGSTATILRNDAVVLLFDRMTSVSLEHLDDEVAEAAGRICRAVEGIPLALVLAAGRASEIGIKPLADVLDEVLGEGEGIEILGGGRSADRPDRATLGGTLEWSYRMLTAREQMVFDSLSVFRGRFSVDDALAVCIGRKLTRAEIVAALDRLVQTSLLNAEPHSVQRGTFRLLQPVRDFASRKLASRPRTATIVRRRHAEHFLRIAEETEHLVRGPQDRAALELLDGALADLYAAMRWALATKESDTALRLVNCMWVYWLVRGRGAEAIPMIEAALDLDRTISRDMAMAQMACCQLYWVSGEFGRIRERSREILAVGEALGDDLVWALGVLGFVAMDMFDIADDFVPLRAQEILPSFRRIGDHWYGGQALQTAGGALWHRGDYGRAEALYGESVLGFRKLGHPTTMNSLRGHALMLALLGNLDEAHAELESALVAAYEEGDFVGVAEALCFRGAIARYEDDHAGARAFYRRALSTARDAGYGWMVFWSLDRLVDTDELGLHVAAERFAASIQLLAFTEVMSRHTGLNLAPRERQDHARDLQRARARVGEAAFETAFERGQRLSLDEAIELGLSLDSSTPATT